ncbi:GNAT family N-acetyltransferase [Orbaceae bacterium ESL0721]|nr:GNAT family N-acetyltransferase [Orbaceae bacterium ESL0721]
MLQYLQDDNRIYAKTDDGQEVAEMTFTRVGDDSATIDHTFVDPNYRGEGIADRLLHLVVEQLKQENRKIIPVCSYAVKKLGLES